MKRLLLIALVLCSSLVAADRRSVMRTYKPPAAGGLLIDTDFEGTGIPSGWTTTLGTPDWDNTSSPLSGSQDLKMQDSADCNAIYSFSASSEIWMRFEVTYTSEPITVSPVLLIYGSGFTEIIFWHLEPDGQVNIVQDGGAGSSSSVDAMSSGTHYWIFVHCLKGTGANAAFDLEFSTTSTRTGSGNKFVSYASGHAVASFVAVILNRTQSEWQGTRTFQIDNVKVSNTGWPP